jgi:hypothetical protein
VKSVPNLVALSGPYLVHITWSISAFFKTSAVAVAHLQTLSRQFKSRCTLKYHRFVHAPRITVPTRYVLKCHCDPNKYSRIVPGLCAFCHVLCYNKCILLKSEYSNVSMSSARRTVCTWSTVNCLSRRFCPS